MTWAFLARYCDEAYAAVDARDERLKRVARVRGALDLAWLRKRLDEVTA
jgi:hypothetical protein